MQVQEILIIKNGKENYGISTEYINQISRVPVLMPLPLRPFGVRGLCSVGGNIVSMIDINILLDMPSVDYDASKTRLISLTEEYLSNALLVSEVYNTVEIDASKIDYIDKKDDPIIAIYKYNDSLIQIISLDILISKINKVSIESKEVKSGKIKQELSKEEDSKRFLIFHMQKEKFALEIDYLQEIILADIEVTDIAGSSTDVLGLVTLRDELLLVVDLRSCYGFDTSKNDKNRILIASYDGKRIGLLIDSIIDIKNFYNKDIEYMNDNSSKIKISGVIHDDKSLISFFDHEVLETIIKSNESFIDSNGITKIEESKESAMEVIVFKLSGKEYAFEVDSVAEIIDIVKSTDVAYTAEYIDGIINIRGQIVTIVSLFKKLNITTTINEDSKIIICNIDDMRIGFIVDNVSDILNITENEIKDADDEFFTNILYLDNGKRLVLSMDINKIVSTKG